MPNDLSARLRDSVVDHPDYGLCTRMSLRATDLLAAADLIDAQAKEIERLRAELDRANERFEDLIGQNDDL